MKKQYYTLDVFTEKKLTGNPLAVVLSSDGLSDADMQTIAGEFNLSETVFVFPPNDMSNTAALRIFTPANELPFAGHPIVGTSVLLAGLETSGFLNELRLEVKAGLVVVQTEKAEAGGKACFTVPGIPDAAIPVSYPDVTAQAMSVAPEDIGFGNFVPAFVNMNGMQWLFVPVKSAEAIARTKVDTHYWKQAHEGRDISGVYLYTNDCVSSDSDFHARMYAPDMGIIEDPATGSAASAFVGCLSSFLKPDEGNYSWKLEQGYEMGRPSQITLGAEFLKGKPVRVHLEGHAVILMEGVLDF